MKESTKFNFNKMNKQVRMKMRTWMNLMRMKISMMMKMLNFGRNSMMTTMKVLY